MTLHLPDAISFGWQTEAVFVAGGGTVEKVELYVLNGSNSGEKSGYIDSGLGVGIDGGTAFNMTEYYYLNLSGKPHDFIIDNHAGLRYSGSADVNVYYILSIGMGFSVAPVADGVYIVSRSTSVGLGIEGTPVSGNANVGTTSLHH